jgi:predicted RNA-binding Zn-ribbon protein involved in translation (DUF1610 family)
MSLPRCSHGVYVPAGSPAGISPYCTGCTDSRGPQQFFEVRTGLNFPRTSAFNINDKLHANVKEPNACPDCGSMIWVRKSETGRVTQQRICADCGKNYRAKPTFQDLVKAAMEEIE